MTDLTRRNPIAPMSWYTKDEIAPVNQQRHKELKERLKQFRPLKRFELSRTKRDYKRLRLQLLSVGFNDLASRRQALIEELERVFDRYKTIRLRAQIAEEGNQPLDSELLREGRDLKTTGNTLKAQIEDVEALLEPYMLLHEEFTRVKAKLDNHFRLVKEKAEYQRNLKEFEKEARITVALIREQWSKLPGCHYNKPLKKGNFKAIAPSFDIGQPDPDSIWLKIKTSTRTMFGYRPALPQNVLIDSLIDEKVIKNLAASVGRQITYHTDKLHVQHWLRVNRLNTPDSLPDLVHFTSVMEVFPEDDLAKAPFPLGVMGGRITKFGTLEEYPHILIGGATKSGKSNQLHAMMCCWLQTQSPDDMRLLLFDLKGGMSMSGYKKVPHVIGNISRKVDEVLPKLTKIITLMERRQLMFEARGIDNLVDYNRRVSPENKLPRIVVIIDEMQGLALEPTLKRPIHNSLAFLAAQGRAVGVHVINCTQFPNRQVIPNSIKSNMVLRLAFKMASNAASMVILDNGSAKDLPNVQGRNIFTDGNIYHECQGPLTLRTDMEAAVQTSHQFGEVPLPFPEYEELDGQEKPKEIPIISTSIYTHEDFLKLAIDKMNFKLSPRAAHDLLAAQGISPGIRHLTRLHDEIVERGTVTIQGQTFEFAKDRKATVLKPQLNGVLQD